MDIQTAIRNTLDRHDLTGEDMTAVMRSIMTGKTTQAQIGGFLVGLRLKGETIDEIVAAARVMRDLATQVTVNVDHVVDTCGTGGDGSGTFNISTASAFVVAGAGGHVAKHGNRSVSSKSGSADVLEAIGVNLSLSATQVAKCIEKAGIGFMFAPAHHGAMKHAIGPRREMGVRTIFNILGPLTNPANAPNQVIGVFNDELVSQLAHVLAELGSRHAMIVHASDGLDEISISSSTYVAELKNGTVTEYRITPEQFGMELRELDDIMVTSVNDSVGTIMSVLEGSKGPAHDIVTLNAGAGIYVCGLAETLDEGVHLAKRSIRTGRAKRCLEKLVTLSNEHI